MTSARVFSLLSDFSVVLGGFLLFAVQPMLTKALLPAFGGSDATWTVCLLFFQAWLLVGYAYVYGIASRVPARVQALIHVCLLAAAAFAVPFTLPAPNVLGQPEFGILAFLFLTAGLPAMCLVTTSPLLQTWRERFGGKGPHHFAISNAGAFVALLTYPLLIDSRLDLSTQQRMWAIGFMIYAAAFAACSVIAALVRKAASISHATDAPDPRSSFAIGGWAFAGCALFMSVTASLSEAVPAVPLMWVLPLALYLGSFVLVFAKPKWQPSGFAPILLAAAALLYFAINTHVNLRHEVLTKIFALCTIAGIGCTVAHARMRDSAGQASTHPRFYLSCAAGGFLAGALVTLIAPHMYPSYWEMPVLVLAVCLLLCRGMSWPRYQRIAIFSVALASFALWVYRESTLIPGTLSRERNFYGTLHVRARGDRTLIINRGIAQGVQFREQGLRLQPSCDFSADSGVGLSVHRHQARRAGKPIKVGMVGLGAGMILGHAKPGDEFTFFEINPSVIRAAQTHFTFLKDSPAQSEVQQGDGRLLLEHVLKEKGPQQYDVLIIDAFHGGAPPMHLLTREAFSTYFALLKPNGILAIDSDTNTFDYSPLHRGQAVEMQTPVAWVKTNRCHQGQSWALYTRDDSFWKDPEVAARISQWPDGGRAQIVWTDASHNLISILDVPGRRWLRRHFRKERVDGFDLSTVSN